MWLMLNDSYLSFVAYEADPPQPDKLLVRARIQGDIQRVFPKAKVYKTKGADYRFRAIVTRAEVAGALVERVLDINYRNFKNSVREHDRHDAYMDCWTAMLHFQGDREHGRKRAPKGGLALNKTGTGTKIPGFDYLWDDLHDAPSNASLASDDQPEVSGRTGLEREPSPARSWEVQQKRDGGRKSVWGHIKSAADEEAR